MSEEKKESSLADLGIVEDAVANEPAAGGALAAQMPANVWETTFEDDSITSREFEDYKGRKGVTDRIAILHPNKVIIARSHFKDGLGYILCNSKFRKEGKVEVIEQQAPCCEHLDTPRKRIALLILKYHTDPQGKLVAPFGFTLLAWRFSPDKFDQLRNINAEWPLGEHDILAMCEEEKFQNMTFSVCKEAVYKKPAVQEKFGKEIENWFSTTYPKMTKATGRKLSNQEILQRLGKAGMAPSTVAPTMTAPITEIADLLT